MRMFNDEDRALARRLFDEVAFISKSGTGRGVTRAAYGSIETRALKYLQEEAFGLKFETMLDSAGNLWMDLDEAPTREPHTVIGSHLDSVPEGGNFDGLAGVIAGMLVLKKLRERGECHRIRVVAFRGEESAWFGVPYIGAKAFLGLLTPGDLARVGVNGLTLGEAMTRSRALVDRIMSGLPCMYPKDIAEFWELHIEQGPVLVEHNQPIGIVNAIRGNMRMPSIRIAGKAGHSGTVPREQRSDAVFAFADFVHAMDATWARVIDGGGDLVLTVGRARTLEPCNITRIPDNVEFCLEWRSAKSQPLLQVCAAIDRAIEQISAARGVTFHLSAIVSTKEAMLDPKLAKRAEIAAQMINTEARYMQSGAGHDAALFANAGIPTGMIFIRNANGSHNPDEAMDIEDFIRGVEVLYTSVTNA